MTLEDRIQAFRLRVLRRAEELGNVRRACEDLGVSRTVFYRWRRQYLRYGPTGLHPKPQAGRCGRPTQCTAESERELVAIALAWPTRGPQWFRDQLGQRGVLVATSTIQRWLRALGLHRRAARLAILEDQRAQRTGVLTEGTRRRQRRGRRHIAADAPGDLVSIDTFYIGRLKGVGKVWQVTACDAASSYAFAQISRGARAEATAAFLRDHVAPAYAAAGWPLRCVLTDNGREFFGAFAATCRGLGIQHRRIRPGHAWTNGFVERLQGTILHEHWRVVFRQRFFRRPDQLQESLSRFVRFYNEQRPHQGYRLRGQVPALLFHGAIADAAGARPLQPHRGGARTAA